MKKLFLSGIVVCNFLNISYRGISSVCVWWYMKFHAWLPVFKILLIHDCASGLAFSMSLLFCCYSSLQLLICSKISRGSIHVSLLYNTYDCHTYNIRDTNTEKGRKKTNTIGHFIWNSPCYSAAVIHQVCYHHYCTPQVMCYSMNYQMNYVLLIFCFHWVVSDMLCVQQTCIVLIYFWISA